MSESMADQLKESPVKHPETTFWGWRYAPAEHKMLHSFLSSKMNLIASVLLLLLLAAAIFAPWITPVDPTEVSLTARLTPPIWYAEGQSPHWLGTDNLGRDIYSVIMYGLRISLMVGILSVLLAATIGVSLGLIAGYARGFWESLVMRAVDIQLSLPMIMVALCIMVILRTCIRKYKQYFFRLFTFFCQMSCCPKCQPISVISRCYISKNFVFFLIFFIAFKNPHHCVSPNTAI